MKKLKQAIISKLLSIIQNPHTSGSGLVIFLSYVAEELWPQKKAVIENTRGAAAVWLGLNAGDASRGKTQLDDLEKRTKTAIDTRDTSHLANPDLPAALQPISPGKPQNPS